MTRCGAVTRHKPYSCHSLRGVASGCGRGQGGAMDDVRVGLLLPTREAQVHGWDARRILDVARRAEALGFTSLWAGDSLRRPRYEPLSVLAAVAAVTERATLGTAALMPAFRQPLGAAASLASIDALSGGRLVVAVGAGFPGLSKDELALVGVPYRRRFRWLDDVVALWRTVWLAEPPSAFGGDVLRLDWLPDIPRPHRPGGPPVWLAGATDAALARTGRRYDGWIPYPPDPADYASGLASLRLAASDAGRDPFDITPALYLTVLLDDDPERGRTTAEEWCLRWYELPFEMVSSVQAFVIGSAAEVAAGLARYVDAGARHVVVRMASADAEGDLARVADALLRPELRV
jgi:alkanesulfonate monooxygenase SsuD/methylene tetrahydromethanopterin reductase-like flavin-dependent oxidoreductase (luciferase family)